MTRQNPVPITVNDKEDTVIISYRNYISQQNYAAKLEAKPSLYAHLAQAADDVKSERVQELDAAYDDILNELKELEL